MTPADTPSRQNCSVSRKRPYSTKEKAEASISRKCISMSRNGQTTIGTIVLPPGNLSPKTSVALPNLAIVYLDAALLDEHMSLLSKLPGPLSPISARADSSGQFGTCSWERWSLEPILIVIIERSSIAISQDPEHDDRQQKLKANAGRLPCEWDLVAHDGSACVRSWSAPPFAAVSATVYNLGFEKGLGTNYSRKANVSLDRIFTFELPLTPSPNFPCPRSGGIGFEGMSGDRSQLKFRELGRAMTFS